MKETKTKILQSAISVWGKDMIATLDDIASATGISRRTLHRHYTGSEDLMNSVFNYIIEEQLIRLNDILAKYPGTKDRLREFLYLDIESGSQYMVFCQLRKTKYVEFEEENENFKELYAIYMALFKQPIENGQIRKELSASWLETFYMLMVETSLRSMEEGEDKEECFQMAWSCFWNGIKSDSK